jgi:hypothetical protein
MRILATLAGALVLCAFALPGRAAPAQEPPVARALCADCKDAIVTMDIGTCGACGGQTTSGAYKLCDACARAKGVCKLCGGPLPGAGGGGAGGGAAAAGAYEVELSTADG